MTILDTNVLSEFMREKPDATVVHWLDRQPRNSVWTTAINVYESRSGLLNMPDGRRRIALIAHLERLLAESLQGRVINFDLDAAEHAAELTAAGRKAGRPREPRDTMIAGIVLANHATLATRNVKHFEDIAKWVINPWEAQG
jgi:toxin FitB